MLITLHTKLNGLCTLEYFTENGSPVGPLMQVYRTTESEVIQSKCINGIDKMEVSCRLWRFSLRRRCTGLGAHFVVLGNMGHIRQPPKHATLAMKIRRDLKIHGACASLMKIEVTIFRYPLV